MSKKTSVRISGYVWIVSGIILFGYGLIGLFDRSIPGIEQVVIYLSNVNGRYIYAAAFTVIFIEGLYLIGNFFPGSTMLIILAIGSQIHGFNVFMITISTIFIGWSLSGIINVGLGKMLQTQMIYKTDRIQTSSPVSNPWLTWFPAFRSNYEVAQIIEGNSMASVILSSIKIKIITSLMMAIVLLIASFFVDVSKIENEEGFLSLAVVAIICISVGLLKIKRVSNDNK